MSDGVLVVREHGLRNLFSIKRHGKSFDYVNNKLCISRFIVYNTIRTLDE